MKVLFIVYSCPLGILLPSVSSYLPLNSTLTIQMNHLNFSLLTALWVEAFVKMEDGRRTGELHL